MAEATSPGADATVRSIVRDGDKDTYLATLFAPESCQPALFALAAFSVELARIPLVVSEAQVGEIRLQWWADTLATLRGDVVGAHPVAAALAQAISTNSLPLPSLQAMVEARRFDLYADVMPDMTAVEAYFGETQSALMQLACLILDPAVATRTAEAAGLAGVAFGLARMLAVSRHPERWVPTGKSRADLISDAQTRLLEARQAISRLPVSVLPAFLPVATAGLYLDAAKAGRGSVPQWRRQWRIWRAARRELI